MQSTPEQQKEAGWNLERIVMTSIQNMLTARAAGEDDKYFIHFEDTLQMVMPYLVVATRIRLEQDNQKLLEEVAKIKNHPKFNEDSKKQQIRNLKRDFADCHKLHIANAMTNMGFQKIASDGEINESVLSLANLIKIVRTNNGLETDIEEGTAPVNAQEED